MNTSTSAITPLSFTNAPDSAIMNPSRNVLGLRRKKNLMIWNVTTTSITKIKTTKSTHSVLFWRWLDSGNVVYVTKDGVYFWSMEGDDKPVKKLDISSEAEEIDWIGYDQSNDGNWAVLSGIDISSANNNNKGVLLLYNVRLNKYLTKRNCYGGCLINLNIDNEDCTLFCFVKKDGISSKLSVVEVGNEDNPLRIESKISLEQQNDFIVSMVPESKFGCIYGMSYEGTLYIHDILTGRQVFSRRVLNVCSPYSSYS